MSLPPVHIFGLGCPKNDVDTEVMAGLLHESGFPLTGRPDDAVVILVNTCAFILPAKEEAIDEILQAALWKKRGPCRYLMVAGCLPQRYGRDLARILPEVDRFLGIDDIPHIATILRRLLSGSLTDPVPKTGPPTFLMDAQMPRRLSTPHAWAYLKIADGCSNRCSYCVIPEIRGHMRSRPLEDIAVEAERIVSGGVREIILVAQDTTAWGRDLPIPSNLGELLHEVASIRNLRWLRFLYAHPARLDRELLETMTAEGKVCPYIDLPVQHIDDKILRLMGRHGTADQIRGSISLARAILPGAALRTSLIVGFPGETEIRFRKLQHFVRESRFDHLGVFPYSCEEGTSAAALRPRIATRLKEDRRVRLMAEQAVISREILSSLVGTIQEVLIEGRSEDPSHPFWGRCRRQAPEIDGVTYVHGETPGPGAFVPCRITGAGDYDLFAAVAGSFSR